MEDEDISKLDPDLILARQLEELEKERKELQVNPIIVSMLRIRYAI